MILHSTTVATFGPQLPKPVATPRGAPGKPKDDQERPPTPMRNPGTTRSPAMPLCCTSWSHITKSTVQNLQHAVTCTIRMKAFRILHSKHPAASTQKPIQKSASQQGTSRRDNMWNPERSDPIPIPHKQASLHTNAKCWQSQAQDAAQPLAFHSLPVQRLQAHYNSPFNLLLIFPL